MSLNLDNSAWRRVKFGDVVRNVNNTTKDPASLGIDRVIALEHMDPGELSIQRWGDVADGTTFTRVVTPGQTLFGKRRAYQRKVAYAEFEAICSGDIYTFEAIDGEMVPELLPFLVQSEGFFDHALGTSAGSLSPRTNWRDLANFAFDLPPVPEQERLADLLWAVERHRVDELARRDSVSLIRDLVLDRHIETLVQRQSVDFSSLWDASPESGWSAPPTDEHTGRLVLSLAAIGANGYRYGQLKNIEGTPSAVATTLSPGDLLISRANTVETVGRAAIFPEDRCDVSFPDTMMRLRLRAGVLPQFVEKVISSSHGRRHMRRTAAGSATSMVKINRASLGKMQFPDVAPAEQELVLAELRTFEDALEAHQRSTESLALLRSALLREIFGGN